MVGHGQSLLLEEAPKRVAISDFTQLPPGLFEIKPTKTRKVFAVELILPEGL